MGEGSEGVRGGGAEGVNCAFTPFNSVFRQMIARVPGSQSVADLPATPTTCPTSSSPLTIASPTLRAAGTCLLLSPICMTRPSSPRPRAQGSADIPNRFSDGSLLSSLASDSPVPLWLVLDTHDTTTARLPPTRRTRRRQSRRNRPIRLRRRRRNGGEGDDDGIATTAMMTGGILYPYVPGEWLQESVLTTLVDRNARLTLRTTAGSGLASASSFSLLLAAWAATTGGHIATAVRRHFWAERAGPAELELVLPATAVAQQGEQGPRVTRQEERAVATRRAVAERTRRREVQARPLAAVRRRAQPRRRLGLAVLQHLRQPPIRRVERREAAQEGGKARSPDFGRTGRGCPSPTRSSRRTRSAFGE